MLFNKKFFIFIKKKDSYKNIKKFIVIKEIINLDYFFNNGDWLLIMMIDYIIVIDYYIWYSYHIHVHGLIKLQNFLLHDKKLTFQIWPLKKFFVRTKLFILYTFFLFLKNVYLIWKSKKKWILKICLKYILYKDYTYKIYILKVFFNIYKNITYI